MKTSLEPIADLQIRLANLRKEAFWREVDCDEGGGDPPLAARAEAARAELATAESEAAKHKVAKLP